MPPSGVPWPLKWNTSAPADRASSTAAGVASATTSAVTPATPVQRLLEGLPFGGQRRKGRVTVGTGHGHHHPPAGGGRRGRRQRRGHRLVAHEGDPGIEGEEPGRRRLAPVALDPGELPGDVGQRVVEPESDPQALVVGQATQAGLEQAPGVGREEEQAEDGAELDLGAEVGVDLAAVEPADAGVQVVGHLHPLRLLAFARRATRTPAPRTRPPAPPAPSPGRQGERSRGSGSAAPA